MFQVEEVVRVPQGVLQQLFQALQAVLTMEIQLSCLLEHIISVNKIILINIFSDFNVAVTSTITFSQTFLTIAADTGATVSLACNPYSVATIMNVNGSFFLAQ